MAHWKLSAQRKEATETLRKRKASSAATANSSGSGQEIVALEVKAAA